MEKKLQPTLEEIVGMIPVPGFLYRHRPEFLYRIYDKHKFKGKSTDVKTTSFFGFTLFWFLSKLKWIRPTMVRYRREKLLIEKIHFNVTHWIEKSPNVAKELAFYIGKIRGYSYVRHRHLKAFDSILSNLPEIYEKQGSKVTGNFIQHVYREVTNAGQNYEKISELADLYKKGNYQINLIPLLEE